MAFRTCTTASSSPTGCLVALRHMRETTGHPQRFAKPCSIHTGAGTTSQSQDFLGQAMSSASAFAQQTPAARRHQNRNKAKSLNSLVLFLDIDSSSTASSLSRKAQATGCPSILSRVTPASDTQLVTAGFCSGDLPGLRLNLLPRKAARSGRRPGRAAGSSPGGFAGRGRDGQVAAPESSCTAAQHGQHHRQQPKLLISWRPAGLLHTPAPDAHAVKAGVQSTTSHSFSFPLGELSLLGPAASSLWLTTTTTTPTTPAPPRESLPSPWKDPAKPSALLMKAEWQPQVEHRQLEVGEPTTSQRLFRKDLKNC